MGLDFTLECDNKFGLDPVKFVVSDKKKNIGKNNSSIQIKVGLELGCNICNYCEIEAVTIYIWINGLLELKRWPHLAKRTYIDIHRYINIKFSEVGEGYKNWYISLFQAEI